MQRGHEPLHAPQRPHRLASHDAARPAAESRASQLCQPRCSRLPAWTGSFLAQLEAKARRHALPPQLLTHTASTGWRVMCRRAEGRRTMAAELTFEAICTSSRNAAALGVDRSRSLKYAGRLAQLSSLRRHATPRLLERFRLLLLGLKWYSDRSAAAVPFQVRGAESDARERTRGRKTFLTRIEETRQDSTT